MATSPTNRPPAIITLEAGWNQINERGIQKMRRIIQEGLNESLPLAEKMDFYTTIYNMCVQKPPHCYTPQLYERYAQSFTEYLTAEVLPAVQQRTGEFLVRELVKRWEDHKIMQKWMVAVFKYLDRFYIKRHNKKPLEEVALNRFRDLVFTPVRDKAVTALLEMVQRDRNREEVDRDLMRGCVQLFVDMTTPTIPIYSTFMEEPFLKATTVYYSREAANWAANDSCPEYLRKTELRFAQERKRLKDYLPAVTEGKLFDVLYKTLLLQHQTEVLNKENTGLSSLLRTYDTAPAQAEEHLSRLFMLYSCVPSSLEPIARTVKGYVQGVGQALIDKVNEEKKDDGFIDELMNMHDRYQDLVTHAFRGHATFGKAMKEAFEHIINVSTFQSSTSELIARYADGILTKGGAKLDEKTLTETQDKLVRIFSYVIDKDMFAEFYRKQLATRLLLQKSASTDAERSMIAKLKLKCGAQFTSKFEGMINDMKQAEDHEIGFKNFVRERHVDLGGIDFTVQTLTSGFWPSYPTDEAQLPPAMNKCLDTFNAYYATKTSNRKLRWMHNLGVVTIAGNFTRRRIDLVVSGIQAAILLLFNETEELTIEQIATHTGLSDENLKAQLRTIASGAYKILLKTPPEGYRPNHTMRLNRAFTHPQRRIRLPTAATKFTVKERETTQLTVTEDRRHSIEAAIVRIMKSRKTLLHQQLISEVSAQLMQYFQPDPRIIKRRIEDLIQRDYLERDADKPNVYHYLA